MRRRRGFTITELLVAMALIVFIMYILAEAFSAGSTAFRNLKAIGDMNEKLRTTSTILRRYLQADHFGGRQRLSDADFWKDGPPAEGFLRIYNGSDSTLEGTDLDGNLSYRAVDHGLHFAVKLRGNNRGDFFRATLPANSPLLLLPLQDTRFQEAASGTLCSPTAEVAVFLRDSGDVSEDVNSSTPGQKLYTLYMRQRLCIPDNEILTQLSIPKVPFSAYQTHVEMSCHQDPTDTANLYFNGPADLTRPGRRMGPVNGAPGDHAGSRAIYAYPTLAEEPGALFEGNDILLTNVLSFEVRVLLDPAQWSAFYVNQTAPVHDFVTLHHPAIQSFSGANPSFPATAGTPKVFDTWSQAKDDVFDYSGWATGGTQASAPLYRNAGGQKIRIIAVQITIRIWDSNTKQTRQTSVVVDL